MDRWAPGCRSMAPSASPVCQIFAAQNISGVFIQQFTGTYTINSAVCGASTVCLAGSYIDLMAGLIGGHVLSQSATTPPSTGVTMTSDPAAIPAGDLGVDAPWCSA